MSSDGQFAAAAEVSGYIYTSNDRGVTWTQQTNSGARDWFGVAVSTDGAKLVASDNDIGSGGFFLSTDFGVTWTMDTDLGSGSFGPPIASYDLSRAFVEGPGGFSYAYNPAFVISPAPPAGAPVQAKTIGAPDTGHKPEGVGGQIIALALGGLILAPAITKHLRIPERKK